MVCEAARLEGGKLFILGGGFSVFSIQTFPERIRLAVACVVDGDQDVGDSALIAIEITQDAGPTVAQVSGQVQVSGGAPGVPVMVPFVAGLEFDAHAPGSVQVVVSLDGEIEARFPLLIAQAQTGSSAQPS